MKQRNEEQKMKKSSLFRSLKVQSIMNNSKTIQIFIAEKKLHYISKYFLAPFYINGPEILIVMGNRDSNIRAHSL